jgi:predicted aconitase
MSIRSTLFAATLTLASLGAAHADGLRPIEAKSIDLGEVSGVAYYTVERDGLHVVTTLAQGEAGTPIRVVSVLAPGQSVVLSTPHQAGALQISRQGDSVLVRKAAAVTN